MLPALLALALAAAPDALAARPSGQVPSGQVPSGSWDSAATAARAAVARARLDQRGTSKSSLAERAQAAGLRAADIAGLLDALIAACPARECPGLAGEPAALALVETLGELGGEAEAPVLLRLSARNNYNAERALDEILKRAMADAVARGRCSPPSPAEVAAAREQLHDFVVVRQRGGLPTAEAPTAAELDDLAYFHAAVAQSGPEVGAAVEHTGGKPPAGPDPALERLAAELGEAQAAGDLPRIARSGRAYLERLGFPGPLSTAAETTWAWGGARFSYVLRDLAQANELLGEHALAEKLYRRADPGGGACGTSVSYRWSEQIRGVIRSAERAGACRSVVAERLLDIDGPPDMWPRPAPVSEDYGPARLAGAGFDVARLYRGALLTRGRDDADELRAALARAPAALGQPALARLERLGAEDWEYRVRAVEGLADVGRRAALPELVALLPLASPRLRPRVLAAIGQLAERPSDDPCDDEITGLSLRGIGSSWERHVTSIGDRCDTVLRLDDAGLLAMSLTPWLKDPDPDTRRAAAEALGWVGHRVALPALKRRASDPYSPEGVRVCQDGRCGRSYPVREAVGEAIAAITERSRDDARWRRNDARRE